MGLSNLHPFSSSARLWSSNTMQYCNYHVQIHKGPVIFVCANQWIVLTLAALSLCSVNGLDLTFLTRNDKSDVRSTYCCFVYARNPCGAGFSNHAASGRLQSSCRGMNKWWSTRTPAAGCRLPRRAHPPCSRSRRSAPPQGHQPPPAAGGSPSCGRGPGAPGRPASTS